MLGKQVALYNEKAGWVIVVASHQEGRCGVGEVVYSLLETQKIEAAGVRSKWEHAGGRIADYNLKRLRRKNQV